MICSLLYRLPFIVGPFAFRTAAQLNSSSRSLSSFREAGQYGSQIPKLLLSCTQIGTSGHVLDGVASLYLFLPCASFGLEVELPHESQGIYSGKRCRNRVVHDEPIRR